MVAALLRLRLLSVGNRITRPRSTAEMVGVAVAGIIAIAGIVAIVGLGQAAAATTPELRGAAFTVVGSAVIAAFWLLPFAFRVDDAMAPRAFAPFEIPPLRLAAMLSLTRLLSVPVLLLLLLLTVQTVAWHGDSSAVGVALIADVVVLATCVFGSQVASAVAGRGLVARNVAALLTLLAVTVATPLAAVLATLDWSGSGATYLRRAAAVLDWTPFGVVWGAPAAAAVGDGGLAAWRIVVAILIAAGLAALWWWIVVRAGSTPPRAVRVRSNGGLGMFDVLPPVPGGVIAARSIVYWMRDSRYVVPLLILPVIPVVLAFAFGVAGVPTTVTAWLCLPLIALLIGWSVHNDVANDGTAFWLHVVTGVGGRADRWGRVVPPLIIGAIVVVGGAYLTVWLIDDWPILLPLIALSSCALLVGLGVASAASAIAPYPTVLPGNGPFAQPQALRGGEAVKQSLSLLTSLLLCAPTIALIIAGVVGDPGLLALAPWVGFGSGVVVLAIGTELGAFVVARRAPEILAFTQQN
jgi:ABC-2 type transport system permease protein